MENKLKEQRLRAGMSVGELATKADVPTLAIRRIESSFQLANIFHAKAICRVLNLPIEKVFPGAKSPVQAYDRDVEAQGHVSANTYKQLREAGIEGDIKLHTLKVQLRGHSEPMFFTIGAADADRLFRSVQAESADAEEASFIVFDTETLCVAINLRALMFVQFLWDAAIDYRVVAANDPIDGKEAEAVQIFFDGSITPVQLLVEPEDGTRDLSERNYLTAAFNLLDTRGVLAHERLHIVDEDGESAFLRAGDIAMLTCPRLVIEPLAYDIEEEDD